MSIHFDFRDELQMPPWPGKLAPFEVADLKRLAAEEMFDALLVAQAHLQFKDADRPAVLRIVGAAIAKAKGGR